MREFLSRCSLARDLVKLPAYSILQSELTTKKTLISAYLLHFTFIMLRINSRNASRICILLYISEHSVEIPRTRDSSWVSRAHSSHKSRYIVIRPRIQLRVSPFFPLYREPPSGHLHLLIERNCAPERAGSNRTCSLLANANIRVPLNYRTLGFQNVSILFIFIRNF